MTSIQTFHMLSSSPTTMSMTFKTSDQVPNETTPLWKTYPLFCTHVTSWYYRAKKTQTQQDFWKENGLLHVICVPQWTLYKFIITVHPGDLSDLSAEVETITALLVYHNSLLADLSPSKIKFSFALRSPSTKGYFKNQYIQYCWELALTVIHVATLGKEIILEQIHLGISISSLS